MTKILEAIEITKVVGTIKKESIVDKVSFSMEPGEVLGLLGPNGAGKTTTMKMLLGLTSITSGEAFIFGEKVPSVASRRGVGFLPEAIQHPDYLTVLEYIKYHANLSSNKVLHSDIESCLERVEMLEYKDKLLRDCSKGMRQRVDIARVLLSNAKIVFLDEPFSGLDPCGQVMLKEVINSLKEQNISVLVNSHAVGILEDICERVFIMNKGKILVNDSLPNLLDTKKYFMSIDFKDGSKAIEFSEKFKAQKLKCKGTKVEVTLTDKEIVTDILQVSNTLGGKLEKAAPIVLTLDQLFVNVLKRGES
ncbi:MAG: ABC transporter ATP-binding protein [Candidatus Riflebacteria bacterium]|nr:ABC transporter ATP-binding protein [Candidatus Riflebacteria bacterium]